MPLFILRVLGSILFALLCVGCRVAAPTQEANNVFHGYKGDRPRVEVATVDTSDEWDRIRVLTIDGQDINLPPSVFDGAKWIYHSANVPLAELKPGRHTFYVYVRRSKSVPAVALVQATVEPGHAYALRLSTRFIYPESYAHYAVRMVDLTTREMVGGRTNDALHWSWNDVQKLLRRMSFQQHTRADMMEQFGVPLNLYPSEMRPYPAGEGMIEDPFPEDALVYKICKRKKPPFTEFMTPPYFPLLQRRGTCGYLFLTFGMAGTFKNDLFVEADFVSCYSHPLRGNYSERFVSQLACRYRLTQLAYAEYHARSGNPYQAYTALERGIINARHKLHDLAYRGPVSAWKDFADTLAKSADQAIEELITQGSILIHRYPDMLTSASRSFTQAAFEKSALIHADQAATVERERLAVYRRFASQTLVQQAEQEFARFFGTMPH